MIHLNKHVGLTKYIILANTTDQSIKASVRNRRREKGGKIPPKEPNRSTILPRTTWLQQALIVMAQIRYSCLWHTTRALPDQS